MADDLPLLRRFQDLTTIPRAPLGAFPTPVQRITFASGRSLWVKRDDQTSTFCGGNKVRALEWLLGRVQTDDVVLTVGPRGSTHALATAIHTSRRHARTIVVRWSQEMNPVAERVAELVANAAHTIDTPNVPMAYAVATWQRLRHQTHWIPAGGTTPLGMLGHVNAGMELADQVERGECPTPSEIVVPLGTGGTVAGIALGLRIRKLAVPVRAVRVAPRIIASHRRVMRLVARTAAFIERIARTEVPRVLSADVIVEDRFFGGGYGRPLLNPPDAKPLLLDDTYSRKAFAAAAAVGSDNALFWLTFDGRQLQEQE